MIQPLCYDVTYFNASCPYLNNLTQPTFIYLHMNGRAAPVPRPWIRSAEVRVERRYENGNTTTTFILSPTDTTHTGYPETTNATDKNIIKRREYGVNTCLGTTYHGSNWSVAICSQTGIYSLWPLIDFSSVCCSLSRWLSLGNWCATVLLMLCKHFFNISSVFCKYYEAFAKGSNFRYYMFASLYTYT